MYQIPELLKFPNLFHAFSTKAEGNMANSILGKVQDFTIVLPNREKFLSRVGVNLEDTVCMWVQHSDEIVVAKRIDAGKSVKNPNFAVKVDGMVTNESHLCPFLLIADCLPVIFYDSERQVVGLMH